MKLKIIFFYFVAFLEVKPRRLNSTLISGPHASESLVQLPPTQTKEGNSITYMFT